MFDTDESQLTTEEFLQMLVNYNVMATNIRNRIRELEIEGESFISSEDERPEEITHDEIEPIEDSFEDEISYYLADYQKLEPGFSKEEFKAVLPFHRHQNYKMILQRLYAESLKEMKELKEFLSIEEDETLKEELRSLIQNEQRKIQGIIEALKPQPEQEIEDELEQEQNRIILAPSRSGNIRIIDEIEHIPSEYYPSFKELVDSIINGTFKGVKRFCNNNILNGICEVKGFQVRILFQRINKNTYALISAFIKKSDNDKGYQEYIKTRVSDYKLIVDWLKTQMEEEAFMQENELNIQQLQNLLDSQDKDKTLKKEMI